MSIKLIDVCKPSVALIKIIEITGILIGAQSKNNRSKYKTPLPSNYSDTVHLLSQNLSDVINYLSQLKDADIANEMASQIYSKTREEGYDYGRAFKDGGEELQDLFITVQRMISVIDSRSSATCCLPLRGTDMIIAITNDIASFALFDATAHILGLHPRLTLIHNITPFSVSVIVLSLLNT